MKRLVNIKIIIRGVIIGFIFFFLLWLLKPLNLLAPEINETVIFPLPIIESQDNFYDQEEFLLAINKADKILPQPNIYAVIVPHHLVGADIIAELIKRASGRPIETVIVIGPNHNNIGRETMATALINWQTPEGVLAGNEFLINQFLTDFKLQANQAALEKEHSVGAIMPFIRHYLPQAQVMPVVLSSSAGAREADQLSAWLKNQAGKNSLVIFSLDFSHYLTKAEADLKDEETKYFIENFLVDKIYGLNNDYVDSPAGLATALLLARQAELKVNIIRQANSFDYSLAKPSSTTSYFGIELTAN